MSFVLALYMRYMFLYSGKGIALYISLFGNASKILRELKFAIESDSQNFFFFAIFNSNDVRYEICLKFNLNAK